MTTAEERAEAVGSCWECGYALRGLESRRCPECGRGFDPADPETMNMGREVRWLAAWLMRPPGWPMYLLLGGAVLVSLWACVVPTRRGAFSDVLAGLLLMPWSYWWRRVEGFWWDLDAPMGRFLLAVALWLALALIWIARRVARGVTVRLVSKRKAAPFAYWRRWLVVPVMFGATVCVCMTRLPTYLGFWASKPWLEGAARDAKADPSLGLAPRVIGVFGRYSAVGSGVTKTGRAWLQVDADVNRADVKIGYDVSLWRQDDGRPPALPARFRATRLSEHWFLVEPERVSN